MQLQEQKAQLRITHVQWQDCKVQMREIAHMCNCNGVMMDYTCANCKSAMSITHVQLQ